MSGVLASGPELAGFEAIVALTGGVLAVLVLFMILLRIGLYWLDRLLG